MRVSLTTTAILLLAMHAPPRAGAWQTEFEKLSQASEDIHSLHIEHRATRERLKEVGSTLQQLRERIRTTVGQATVIDIVGQQQQAEVEYDREVAREVARELTTTYLGEPGGLISRRQLLGNPAGRVAQREFLIEATKLSQLRFARDVTSERLSTMVDEFVRQARELQKLQASASAVASSYLLKADTYGAKSRMENLAMLHALKKADPNNVPAQIARAITLRRLERFESAQDVLDSLPASHPLTPVIHAAKLENAVAAGEEIDVMRAFASIEADNAEFPIVRVLAARAKLATGKFTAAIQDMRITLEANPEDSFVHRDLALAYANEAAKNRRARSKAIEHAQVASLLTSESEWSIELAYAVALCSDQQFEEAVQRAEIAAGLARGETLDYCESMLVSIQNKQQPSWDFRKF